MARLLQRYMWFLGTTFIVSIISLLLWLHEDRWRAHNFRFNSVKSAQLIYAEKLQEALQQQASDSKTEGTDYEDGRFPHLNTKKPKVYIYTLAPKFNTDIYNCLSSAYCFNLHNNGFGPLLYEEGGMSVYNTNQFSLEVIMHYQLLNSEYLTDNPAEADVFYIPSYLGTMFFCTKMSKSLVARHEEMFQQVNSLPYFKSGKPHISALAKIEREMSSKGYPLLQNPLTKNVTYIVIEKESQRSYVRVFNLTNHRVIPAPYPSYVHLDDSKATSQVIASQPLQSRQIFLFLAASTRRSNTFRAAILDQFEKKITGESYIQYKKNRNVEVLPSQLMLTTTECFPNHVNITIQWMQQAVFCLQPHGDSPTRKSFYDSIQSGCIPVIFYFPIENVEYPFHNVLNYTDFTVTIEASRVEKMKEKVFDILKTIPDSRINELHNNVLQVARQLQYSRQDRSKPKKHVDALDMIMDQVRKIYNL